jgi:hypothetical protein
MNQMIANLHIVNYSTNTLHIFEGNWDTLDSEISTSSIKNSILSLKLGQDDA